MEEKRKALYNALSGEYDLGTYEDFTAKLNDESKRRALYDAAGQDYNLGTYEEYSEKLGFGPSGSNVVPMFDDEPQATPAQENVEENSRKLRGLWANFKESSKGLWAGIKGYAGEQLNLFTGSSREEQAALNDIEQLEEQGVDVMQYLADKEDAEFHKIYGMSKDQFLALDKKERKKLVRQASERMLGQQTMMSDAELKEQRRQQANQQAVRDAFNNALQIAGGDLTRAKEILREQTVNKTRGDILIEEATETMNNLRQPEGFAGWVGNLLPQMVPSAAAIAINYITKGKASGLSKALGYGTMGGLTLSTAGMSMLEARNAGATNLEVWTTGIADGAIDIISEMIPFDRVTKRVFSSVKANVAEKLGDAVLTPKGRKELEKLLSDANEKLGGKLFSKKNVGEWLTDTAYEAAGEFTAGALQTITTMIYENPEDYPTISEVLANGWEEAKAGLFMGSIIGGASLAASHAMNKERRQTQGYVDVAQIETENGDVEVVEVVGENPEDGTVTILHGDSVEDVSRDKIGDRFRFSYEEFENGRLRSREDDAIDNGVVNDGQIRGMEETIQRDLEELQNSFTAEEINQIASGTIPANASAEGVAAARRYMGDVQRIDNLHAAKAEQDQKRKDACRDRIESEVGQRFWVQEEGEDDGSGVVPVTETVEEVVYADGRVGYVVGSDEAGNLTMVYNDGSRGFSTRAEIADKESSGEILSNTVMGLDDYLAVKVDIEDVTAEAARMEEEQTANVQSVQAAHPVGSTINVGTAEAKVEVPIIAVNADGAIVQMPDGTTPQLTWADIAHAEGQEVKPKTNAELDQEVVDEYKVAYQPAVKTGQEPSFTEREVEVEQTTPANPLPLKADGSVDQTALWNKDPERWAQWNDAQRQDGGANSLAYINSAIAREQTKLAEIVGAYEAEPDFDARSAMESEIAVVQDRLNRLAVLQQNYAPLITQQNKPDASTEKMSDVQKGQRPRERSVESEVARLYELGLSDEEVLANLDAKVTKVQKALDAQSKKAPKMGADENAYITKKREHQQKMQELQQELGFASAARQAVSDILAQQTQMPDYSGVIAIEKDAEPQNAVEFAARELGLKDGGIKLQRQSFAEHTGYGPSEMKKFFGLFKSKQDGGLTIEQAGERLMELDRENNTGFFNQNDPNAGLNAILDAIGAVNTIGELRSYVVRQRQAEAQREADAAYSAMMAEYEATYGETMEERAHYDEVMRSEILINGLSENEQQELNNIIFAEEILQNGTEGYQTEASGVYESETGSNATDVEPGTEGVYTGSNGILQETQSDNSGRDAESQENQRRSEGEGGEQDALPSVPTGESTTAVESSLDEDMPDFTSSASSYFPSDEMKRKFSTMRARINDWAQKLGVQVRIMETLDDVVNQSARQQILAGRKVYGYFDPATGEVAFYLPDFLSLDGHELTEEEFLSEIDKTYIHEVVSHRGLRGLLGEEKYGELCDMVWDAMTEQQKANFLSYPGVNGNTRIAADEFIAHFAENVDYNDNRTLWDKIVDFIKDFFNSVELPSGISNESLAELLRHSYRNLAKSAASIDTNANQQAAGNVVLRAANGSLVGMHNISEDKLRKVIKQGGLANPSTAVVNIAEYLLDGYGEISLIMPYSLVDASTGDNVGTYTGDAWTPTYPPISRKVDDKGWKAIKDLIRSVVSEDSPLYHDIINGLENYLEDNRSSKMEFVFLKEKGIEPEIAYKGADGFVGIRNLEAILGVQGLRDGLESYERYKNASPIAKRSFNMWLDAAGNKQAHKELKEQIKKEPKLAEVLKLNEDVSFAAFDSFTYDIFRKEQDAGKIDTYDTMGAAARYVDANNLRGEFEAWLESLMEQAGAKEVFFAGYTRGGDRIYKDNTLENVSRHMRLQGRTNAYDDHGLSATKSALLQRLTSLSQIRKNKARLQNESAYNKEYDALKDRLWSIISQLADMQQISSNQFMNVDYAESRLQEAFTKRNPIAHLNQEYGYDIDPAGEYADELKSFIKDVQQMPAKYFETKFERPVYLNEFAAAVMPTTTSEDVKQAVSEAGLPIFEYDSEVEGSRKEATLKATEGEGIRFRTLGEKGAANLDKAEEVTIRLDNLGVARQMEEAGKDAKAIKLATGWERGADNLWRYEVADDFDLTELENRLQENLNDGLSKTWGVLYPSDLGDLTKSYPDFNVDIMVWVGDEFENTGEYSPATEGDETTFGRPASIEVKAKTVADIKDVLVHEIQHAIQEKEGFAEGGSVFGLKDKLSAELDKRVARIKELRAEGRDAEADELMRMSKGLGEAVINNDADTYQNYRKLAGEVEARNISARLGMSEQERRESLLSETEDVAREDQIVLMDGLGVSEMGTNMLRTRITPEQDAAYLKAVESGDMETAQRMVDEAARLAGYDSPKLYHGTRNFGFTKADVTKSDDGISFFATTSPSIAKTYSSVGGERRISDKASTEDRKAIANELGEAADEYLLEHTSNLAEWLNVKDVDAFALELTDMVYGTVQLAEEQNKDEVTLMSDLMKGYDAIIDKYYDADKYASSEEQINNDDGTWDNRMEVIAAYGKYIQAYNNPRIYGNYTFYATTWAMEEIDCKGANWNNIKSSDLPQSSRPWTTRRVARFMKEEGWKGVILKNIVDLGGRANIPEVEWKSNIYIFFEPQWQVKSADPVTYDDNGKVIPLSERFNPENADIRFRIRGENESAKEFTDSIVKDFKDDYNAVAPIQIVDLNTKEDVARFFNIPAEDITDDDIQFIKNDVEKKDIWAAYHPDLKKIVIFVRDGLADSKKGELALIHENIHAINGKYPEYLALGEYLWNRVEEGTKEHKYKTAIQKFYPEHKWHDELSAYVVSEHMQNGTLDELRYILDLEHTNILNKILNTSGYGKERKSDRAGFFRNVLRKRSSGKVGRASEKKGGASELTAEERRIINEYFPGAFQESDEFIPVGTNRFGTVYELGVHSALEAAEFLLNAQEGYVKGVFSNKEFPSIDMAYGTEKGGLYHIYQKHIVEQNDFDSLEDMIATVEDVLENGTKINQGTNVSYDYEGYRASLAQSQEGVWLLTSFDTTRKKGDKKKESNTTIGDQSAANEMNGTLVSSDSFIDKDSKNLAKDNNGTYENIRYRVVSDQETLDRLNSEPTIKVYRAMQLIDGKLYPPMSAKVDGELRQPIELGQWEEAEERPDLVDEKGRFKLDKGNKSSLKARYNPYFHTSPTPLNDQFSSAQTRPELVTVEVEVPESELTSGYKAEKAKDSVGKMEWKAGVVQSKLSGTRTVILSRWDKPVRIVPDSEVADVIVDMFEGRDITMPSNVVTPSLRAELEKRGVPFVETDNQGNPVEEVSFRVTGTPTDEVVANGLQLTPAQTAEVAANIFAALPEESRKKITEGLNGNVLGLKDAILQIPTSLATKENWNDQDRTMADIVAEEMTKMAGEMTRPFSAEEGLWLLYNNLNKGTDLISQASRALVQRNLGFDAETLEMENDAKDGVRFRTVGDASVNAEASLYNRGAVNVWTRLKESYVDMMASVEELVKAIEKRTGKVAQGFENILLALNQQPSKGLAAMESYTQKFLNPMFDEIRRIMDKTKMKYEDVVRYVILKHGLERNKKLAQRDARAHYQEIYDDIISKITGMTAAQKRTYLTNAQLKEGDAKAELATLQAVDMSAMTDEEKREHKKKLAAARKAVEEAEEHLKRAQKIASMSEQEAQDELDKIFEKIENGTDSVFKEMRENDYSGISSMFYDQLGVDRKNFSTEEQYQAALMEAKKDRYSSLKDIEAAAEAEVKSFEGKTDTKELWKRINAATKETLRQQYEANMISRDQYLNLRDMFEYYVPLRGFKDNTAEDMYTYYRKPNSTGYTKPILGAEGRKTEAESPFGWIAAMAGSAIASNVKNEAKLALYYFVSNRPENGIATISKTWFVDSGEVDERGKKIFKPAYPPFSEDLSSDAAKANYEAWQENMRELQKKGQAYEAGQRLNLGNAVVNISDANKPEHIVNVKVGGKDYTIVINGNPRAAQAINGDLNIEGTSQDYGQLFGPVLRWMSSVNTSYNPEFWITNMMRDMAFTMMSVNIKEDPAYRRKFKKNYLKAFKVVSLVAKNENGTIGDSYLEQQYKDFVKYGGVTGYTQIKDSETWEQEIENYLSSTDPESLKSGKVMRGMKSVFHAAHRFGESLEQVSRFAAFLTARETGKSINEAINDAKEITVNFNRKGSGKMITLEEAKYLTGKNGQPLTKPQQWMVVGLSSIAPLGRRFIMFFNAAIQGLNATYKLMKKNPKRFTGWALGYAAVGMMNAVLHAMLDDDDDYLDIPQYERRNSLMIGGNGAYFKWALPQEARAFYALGDLAVETVMGRNPHQNFLGEALKIGTEILPVNPSEGWKAFMPSVAIPFIELALNEDYKGAPIYNEQKWLSEEEKERTAKWSNAYQGTGWTYVKIAQGLNFITGGDKHDAGLINLQPEKLEHLVQSAFGGTIRTADKFINTISAALDPEEPMTVRQTPFLNRFLTINDERFKNVHVNDVFDYYKADAEHALTLEKQYIKDRDMDSLTELRSSDEYRWAKIYGKYKKPLKAIQDKIKVADGTAEKKELMKQQDELKKRMIKEVSEL